MVSLEDEVAAVMRSLEDEFEEKKKQSYERLWCEPVPHKRKAATVSEFTKPSMNQRRCRFRRARYASASSRWTSSRSLRTHMLWKRFTTVVMLKEQVRAAVDIQLQRLLTRIREGIGDQSDVGLLNQTCYQETRRIPWESGITVVTPLTETDGI
jgi:hypothetical protein